MQIPVSLRTFYKPIYRGRGWTIAADRNRTYDLNLFEKKIGFIGTSVSSLIHAPKQVDAAKLQSMSIDP